MDRNRPNTKGGIKREKRLRGAQATDGIRKAVSGQEGISSPGRIAHLLAQSRIIHELQDSAPEPFAFHFSIGDHEGRP